MAKVEPETVHRRLANAEFLASDDMPFFEDLRVAVLSLLGPDETIEFPKFYEARSWSKLYAIYLGLKQRDRRRDAKAEEEAKAKQTTTPGTSITWQSYLAYRAQLLESKRRDEIDSVELEYLGIQPNDLDSPTIDDPQQKAMYGFAPHPQWEERGWRISQALGHWQQAGPVEKANIPHALATRRLERTVEKLALRVQQLEERLGLTLTGQPVTDKTASFH
jgi:hypothetical protein